MRITIHRLVFNRDRSLVLGDAISPGVEDDRGARLPMGGRCTIDSILALASPMQFIVSVSHYPPGT